MADGEALVANGYTPSKIRQVMQDLSESPHGTKR